MNAGPRGFTALMNAAIFNNTNVAQLLLQAGANKNIKNQYSDGQTAEDMARANGHEKLANIIRDWKQKA